MRPGILNLFVRNNETFSKTLVLRDSNQNPINLQGFSADMQARYVPLSPIIIIELSTANSRITLDDNTLPTPPNPTGSITLEINVDDLLPLPIGNFMYDLTITDGSGNSYTVLTGNFNIIAGVTEETQTPLIIPTGGVTQTGVYTLQGPAGPQGPAGSLPSLMNVVGNTLEIDGVFGVKTPDDTYLYISDWWLQEVRSSTTINRFRLYYYPNNLEAFTVTPTGNVGIGIDDPPLSLWVNGDVYASGTYQSASDIRLKKNISNIHNALDKIKRISGICFDWKLPEERDYDHWRELKLPYERQAGLLAQQIKEILPEAVSKVGDTYAVNAVAIIALLVEAVKELNDTMERCLAIKTEK